MSAHRSVRRRQARRFVFRITNKRTENRERVRHKHQLVAKYPISGGVYAQQALALVPGRNRENRHRFAKVRGSHRPSYQVQKPQQTQHAKTGGSAGNYCHKRGPHTWRVISHLSDCSGGMVFFRLGGSCHGRARSSRLPHQLSFGSGV